MGGSAMAKVPSRTAADNGRGAGARRRHGDRLEDLRVRVRAFERARTADRENRRSELASFVESLLPEQRKTIIRSWLKSPRTVQKHLHEWIGAALGGIGGPAERLLAELRDER